MVKANQTLSTEIIKATKLAEKLLTIGALAKACNATVRTLRYYEELDLINPETRSAGGYRLYVSATITRVQAILSLQALNYSLEEIATLLGRSSEGFNSTTRKRRVSFTKLTLTKQANSIQEKLASLQAMQTELTQRFATLANMCEPCAAEKPDSTCCQQCPHQTVHSH